MNESRKSGRNRDDQCLRYSFEDSEEKNCIEHDFASRIHFLHIKSKRSNLQERSYFLQSYLCFKISRNCFGKMVKCPKGRIFIYLKALGRHQNPIRLPSPAISSSDDLALSAPFATSSNQQNKKRHFIKAKGGYFYSQKLW